MDRTAKLKACQERIDAVNEALRAAEKCEESPITKEFADMYINRNNKFMLGMVRSIMGKVRRSDGCDHDYKLIILETLQWTETFHAGVENEIRVQCLMCDGLGVIGFKEGVVWDA